MKPIVNTDVKMTKNMLRALTMLETYCIATDTKDVNEQFVIDFLNMYKVKDQFKSEYLYQ